MFNINTFNAHKQGIRENMESNLIWDKYHKNLNRASSTYPECRDIEIKFDDSPEKVSDNMIVISHLLRDGVKVTQREITEQPYCTERTVGVEYFYEVPKLRNFIEEYQVITAMKKFMQDKIRREINNEYVYLDCKVMDLFKSGAINWETVLESHGNDCSL